ncbi:MAG: 2-oxoglutarate dehydrogenase complex dihydrolipoyllysine-residue succinyltransferase [Planctomycetota bacterium]
MPVEITIPSPGESITEVVLGPWHKKTGEWVERDETLVEIESDKVTLEVPAPEAGLLEIVANEGDERNVGDVIGVIDSNASKPAGANGSASADAAPAQAPTTSTPAPAAAVAAENDQARATSVAKKIAADKGVNLTGVTGTGPSGRITKSDVLAVANAPASTMPATVPAGAPITVAAGTRGVRREKMSKLRARIAERLVSAQQTAAMLTTFNEADMTEVMALRKRFKESFIEKYNVNLGFMSFFVKACVSALQSYPRVNAYIDGGEIEFHDYCDVSVAVGTPKGLVVPVLRNVETMSFAEIEGTIKDFAIRARDGKLSIDEMTGGTFTISNGGVYGSLNSTPILNPPQSGILGMHKIMKRPMEDPDNPGQIALRPMMYLAMSYDHRIVDGAEAVGFLVHVKECIENPERLLLGI